VAHQKKYRTGRIYGKQLAKDAGIALGSQYVGAGLGALAGLAASKGGRGLIVAGARRLVRRPGSKEALAMAQWTADVGVAKRQAMGAVIGGLVGGGTGVHLASRSAEKTRKKLGLGGKKINWGRALFGGGALRLSNRAYRANRGLKPRGT